MVLLGAPRHQRQMRKVEGQEMQSQKRTQRTQQTAMDSEGAVCAAEGARMESHDKWVGSGCKVWLKLTKNSPAVTVIRGRNLPCSIVSPVLGPSG